MKLEATKLRNCYAVRPEGALGTCGWINGIPWTVEYIKASSAADAIRKVQRNELKSHGTKGETE